MRAYQHLALFFGRIKMIEIQGKGVSNGVAAGRLYYLKHAAADVYKLSVSDLDAERSRIALAMENTSEQLNLLAEKCRTEAGEASVFLFETYAMLADDEDLIAYIDSVLEAEGCNAEYAVKKAGERYSAILSAMDDDYMRERAVDIIDVTKRIINNLMGSIEGGIDCDTPVVLASDDISPSELLQLDSRMILALATRGGSYSSHTAILARAMGIPAVCGLGAALEKEFHGRFCYIDGETGKLVFEPDEQTLASIDWKSKKQRDEKEHLQTMVGLDDVTPDGRELPVCCNIGSPDDIAAVKSNGGQGIGLFRSEYLYLKASDYPSEEEQFAAYKAAAQAMDGKRVVIRTLDIGADKQVGYFGLAHEENPAMGIRAIRICLNRPDVFRTQLRALYRASVFGNVAIMFPMITSVWEIRECKRVCASVMKELESEGIPFNKNTETGIMIETPASVFIADELAKEVDFFSVGTNDLTQYILACDRQAADLDRFFDPHHPAVLRAIKTAADAAHAAGIRIGICGELGADKALLPTFIAMGIDELSVSPAAVLPLRAAIRSTNADVCSLELLG